MFKLEYRMLGISVAHISFKNEITRPIKNRINGNESPLSFHVYTPGELLLCILIILAFPTVIYM